MIEPSLKGKIDMLDKDLPDFWKKIKPGTAITISDRQAISDSMEEGKGVGGQDYIIETIGNIRELNGLSQWLMFKLQDESQELYLVVKMVDDYVSLHVMFEVGEFYPGNRRDLIERGDNWIFVEPEDLENFTFDELEFVPEIVWTVEMEEEGKLVTKDVTYRMKGQGVIHGRCDYDPPQEGLGRIMASVAEYFADTNFDNRELMILELGGEGGDKGGLIMMLVGAGVMLSEVDVLHSMPEAPVKKKKKKKSFWGG